MVCLTAKELTCILHLFSVHLLIIDYISFISKIYLSANLYNIKYSIAIACVFLHINMRTFIHAYSHALQRVRKTLISSFCYCEQ